MVPSWHARQSRELPSGWPGTDNIVVRNYSYDNATAFVVLASNQMGTVVSGIDAVGINGSSGGNLDATVGPWSNFAR